MADYWKSTPKYWCKYCNTFVRDTKFEKQQHEATGKHQGAIQRSLRTLHKDKEREGREQQRAKDEVARLNGIVSGSEGAKDATARKPPAQAAPPRQRTEQDRQQLIAQLAAMGVEVPAEFRQENAMAGNWQVVPKTQIKQELTAEEAKLNVGVRKRKVEEEEEEEVVASSTKKGWGRTFKTLPETEDSIDLESLFPGDSVRVKSEGPGQAAGVEAAETKQEEHSVIKPDSDAHDPAYQNTYDAAQSDTAGVLKGLIKREADDDAPLKQEQVSSSSADVVFKKRKKATKSK